ncbi:hypothetical protein GCM10022393_09720 [Aquimarina addita]|uniref:Thioredoxin domain-containing protein n=1 Tax=Aquimarina addita TaxID=870485 RepID=A0ABP7XCQ9_9FLAO
MLVVICFSCKKETTETTETATTNQTITASDHEKSNKAEIPVYNFEEFEPLLYTDTDTTYIINFWAMWCAPCVKELPYFETFSEKNKDKKVKVILVSLDFPDTIDSKLIPFLKKKNIQSEVVLLDAPDQNSWINKVNPDWSGSIPYTIVFNHKNRAHFERSFENLQDLENVIAETINNE